MLTKIFSRGACPRVLGWSTFPLFILLTVFITAGTSVILVAEEAATQKLTPRPEPLEMLDAVGVDASLRVYLEQGKPWDVTNDEILMKILYRLPDFPLMMTEDWAFPWNAEEVKTVLADPDAWQGQFFRLHFQVLTVSKITLPPEAAKRFEFAEYYRLEVVENAVDEQDGVDRWSREPITIFTRTLPQAWQRKLKGEEAAALIDQPGSAVAMFLKAGFLEVGVKGQGGVPQFYFVTDRVAWHPETMLGRLGMDVGLFDLVHDQRKIGGKERETFYQLLAAVGRAEPGTLFKEAKTELGTDKEGHQKWTTAATIFNRPQQMRGKLALLKGRVRRAIRVEVRDPDIVSRFGIRYYYELYLFTQDSQSNPIVVCARELPKGMPIGSGSDYGQQIQVAGIMLKSWAFTPGGDATKEGKRQLAPLLIADEPIWVRQAPKPDSPWMGAITAAALVIGLFVIWFFLRRQAKADLAARRRRQER